MKNEEKLKIIQYHWNQLERDCPCTYSIPTDRIKVDDPERMPKDEAEEAQWKLEYDNRVDLTGQKAACQQNLKDTDYMLLSDFEYKEDLPNLLILRADWKRIIKSDKLETIPPKPFS